MCHTLTKPQSALNKHTHTHLAVYTNARWWCDNHAGCLNGFYIWRDLMDSKCGRYRNASDLFVQCVYVWVNKCCEKCLFSAPTSHCLADETDWHEKLKPNHRISSTHSNRIEWNILKTKPEHRVAGERTHVYVCYYIFHNINFNAQHIYFD